MSGLNVYDLEHGTLPLPLSLPSLFPLSTGNVGNLNTEKNIISCILKFSQWLWVENKQLYTTTLLDFFYCESNNYVAVHKILVCIYVIKKDYAALGSSQSE